MEKTILFLFGFISFPNAQHLKKDAHERSNSIFSLFKKKIYYSIFIFFLILTFGLIPFQMKANVVGINKYLGSIQTFNETNWTPVTPAFPLTMSGYNNISGTAVTWNSGNNLFYAIILDLDSHKSNLATVDPNTGICTNIGSMGGTEYLYTLTYSSSTMILYTMKKTNDIFSGNDLYSVNITTGATTFLGGPYTSDNFENSGVIAYNRDDGFIYHWLNGASFPFFLANTIEKINTTSFVSTQTFQGYAYGDISGIVYKGGGIFVATEERFRQQTRGVNLTSNGGITVVADANPLVGLGYRDPILPVELTSFLASENGNNITLNWSTASETNNSGFDIERNVNGQWTKAGNAAGNGTSAVSHSYSFTDRNLTSGNYSYRLKQIDFNGNFEYFNLSNEVKIGIPAQFELSQNYPNPFNPTTTISYNLPLDGKVSIIIFDMSGKEIATLVNEVKTAGYYSVNFKASLLSSGVYFYSISSNNFKATKKMLLVK